MEYFVVHGVRVPVSQNEVSPVIWDALQSGSYEQTEARLAPRAVRPFDRILELGAGIGVVTSIMAGIKGVQIWAFEADPKTVEIARRVIEANGHTNVHIDCGILAPPSQKEVKFFHRHDFWMSSVFQSQGHYETVSTYHTRDIDEFIAAQKINLLVMDIEGSEHTVLTEADLPGVERVFLELHDHIYRLAGVREIMAAFVEKGFGYDPRGSEGACVLFSRDLDEERSYTPVNLDL